MSVDQLRDYVQARNAVADIVSDARRTLRAAEHASEAEACQEQLVRLAADSFNLAVVGQFKRGKSSLMNAVIGRNLLPTGVLPLTSAITRLCYGPAERVVLRRQGWTIEQEIRAEELADFVTETGNPGNEKGVIEARVELPVRFLRRGLNFIDTPGVGSSRHENTATTYEFLPDADAVIFVTSAEAPFGEVEEQFLHDVREHVRRLLVVVNKIDVIDRDERESVLGYVRTRVQRVLDEPDLSVHGVSARQALAAKLHADPQLLEASGLPEFEAALAAYLAGERGRSFLIAVLDRILRLVDPETPRADGATSPTDVPGLEESRRAARDLIDRLLAGAPLAMPSAGGPSDGETAVLDDAVAAIPATSTRRPLRAATSGSCPVCTAQSDAVFRFFATWQHALATSRDAQSAFAAAGGFCPAHTWQFQQVASPQGISAGYAPLIEAATDKLRASYYAPPGEVGERLGSLASDTSRCGACKVLHATGRSRIEAMAAHLEAGGRPDGDGRDESRLLCLSHAAALAGRVSPEGERLLLEGQIRRLEELAEDMRAYVLKRDAVQRRLLNAAEESAWRRALVWLAGERSARGVSASLDDRI